MRRDGKCELPDVTDADTYLAVVDATPEGRLALRYAVRRSSRLGARLKLIGVVPRERFMQWGGVQQALEDEAVEAAEAMLAAVADEIEADTAHRPATDVLVGDASDCVLAAVSDDPSVRVLVLAAAADGAPGPLVDFFSGERAGSLPCLVMIVPGGMSPDMLDRLT